MSKKGGVLLSLCVVISFYLITPVAIAEAPQATLSQLGYSQIKIETPATVRREIDYWCKEYHFPYPTLMKWLANKESRYGQDKRCGDGGKACGLYQWHYSTWKEFQKKFNRYDLDWNNNRDQIVMTILALKHGYWYRWGTLARRFNVNPFTL